MLNCNCVIRLKKDKKLYFDYIKDLKLRRASYLTG